MQLSKVKKIKTRHDTVLHCVTLKTYTYIHVDICMIVKVKINNTLLTQSKKYMLLYILLYRVWRGILVKPSDS